MNIIINKVKKLVTLNGEELKPGHLFIEGILLKKKNLVIDTNLILNKHGDVQRIAKGKYIIIYQTDDKHTIYLINDWLSKMPIYYYDSNSIFIASNNFFDVIKICKECFCNLSASIEGLYFAFAKSGMCGDWTQFNEIKYLKRYCRIEIDCDYKIHIKERKPDFYNSVGKKNIINHLDKLFNDSIMSFHEYNKSNRCSNYFTISGGMDSRMVLLSSLKNKINPDLCLSYSFKGSIDNIVSKNICEDNKINLYYVDISNGDFLFDFNKTISMNNGQQIYCGSTGAISINKQRKNWKTKESEMPIIYCGLLGGELLAFEKTDTHPQYMKYKNYSFFDDVVDKLNNCGLTSREIFLENNTRLCQNLMFQLGDCGIPLSPFMDEDFYEYTLSIDKKYLKHRSIYKKWMNSAVPNKYVTTYDKSKITDNALIVFLNRVKCWATRKIKGKTIFDMFSFNDWYGQKEVKEYTEQLLQSFLKNIGETLPIPNGTFLKMFSSCDVKTKLSLLTYLGVINYEKMCSVY